VICQKVFRGYILDSVHNGGWGGLRKGREGREGKGVGREEEWEGQAEGNGGRNLPPPPILESWIRHWWKRIKIYFCTDENGKNKRKDMAVKLTAKLLISICCWSWLVVRIKIQQLRIFSCIVQCNCMNSVNSHRIRSVQGTFLAPRQRGRTSPRRGSTPADPVANAALVLQSCTHRFFLLVTRHSNLPAADTAEHLLSRGVNRRVARYLQLMSQRVTLN
jgi:hypothetical protein